jgi:hypothetical protein
MWYHHSQNQITELMEGRSSTTYQKNLSLCFNWAPYHVGMLGEWRYSSTHSLTSALDGGKRSASRPGRFTPRERAPGTHWIGGWVGPRAVVDVVVKRKIPSPHWDLNPRTPTVQPVSQCYTDWAITALAIKLYSIKSTKKLNCSKTMLNKINKINISII